MVAREVGKSDSFFFWLLIVEAGKRLVGCSCWVAGHHALPLSAQNTED